MRPKHLALLVGPGLLLAAVVAGALAYWGDLPDPMAVHWDFSGEPDGSLPPAALYAGLSLVFAAIWWGVLRAAQRAPIEVASYAAGLWFFGGLLAAVSWLAATANRDAVDWRSASEVGWIEVTVVITVGLAAGLAGWFLAGGRGTVRPGPAEDTPAPAATEPGLVWSGSARGRVTSLAGTAVVVAGIVIWSWATPLLIVAGLIVLVFAEVRLTVGPGGAVVALGPLGVPHRRIALAEIARADMESVSPLSYGGWGYRGRPGVRAFVIRGGEGVRMTRNGKPDLIVTVDDAERGAAAVNSLLGVG